MLPSRAILGILANLIILAIMDFMGGVVGVAGVAGLGIMANLKFVEKLLVMTIITKQFIGSPDELIKFLLSIRCAN